MKSFYVFLVLSGMLAVSLATMCYECDSLDSSCNDGDTGYVVSSSHETNCSQSIWSLDKNGGCSKYKTRTKTFGIWIESVDRTCGQKYYKTNCKEADKVKVNFQGFKSVYYQCSCVGNFCNSGNKAVYSTGLVITAAVAKYLF
ncbi:uncharacterized protein [Watersipora subatra]|uniref:uncharacterized protein isoform X2 n=1 Tax=Watersipora subatra TaxID=2589382 RepID=UPI00355C37C9